MNQKQAEIERKLQQLADKAFHYLPQYFMVGAIRTYQHKYNLNQQALLDWLNITQEQLTELELCRLPKKTDENHYQHLAMLADKFSLDEAKLEQILLG